MQGKTGKTLVIRHKSLCSYTITHKEAHSVGFSNTLPLTPCYKAKIRSAFMPRLLDHALFKNISNKMNIDEVMNIIVVL